MRLVVGAVLLAFALPAAAQEDLTVLTPDSTSTPPRKLLEAYLLTKAKEKFDARHQAVAALKTPDDIQHRQQEMRAKFFEALGDMPERTPLNARVVGRDRRDGYQVERVIYESRPGHHVTANLYLPAGDPPFPGVLLSCGHSDNGKAAEHYQRLGIVLAKNGIAVLCFDPIGQGERAQLLKDDGKPALGNTTEHTMLGIPALLIGRSTASYRVWDGMRSLDYLASRPEIDPKRLGCTGNSGGGTMTAYLMALDDRIAVAAPSCFITSLERLFATVGPQDAEQNITGQVAFGMDHADYVTMRAPKPTLLCVGTQDFFDIQGSWDTFREAKGIYGRLGFGERVDLFESDEPHGLTKPRREATLRWMLRWLSKKDDAAVEGDLSAAMDADLQCTKSGQVLSDFHGKTVIDFNQERERTLKGKREELQATRSREALLDDVRRRIALQPASKTKPVAVGREVSRDGLTIRKMTFETEPGIVLPALLCQGQAGGEAGKLVIVVGGDRDALLARDGQVVRWTKDGARVLVLDVRGWGELSTAAQFSGRTSPFGPDWRLAYLGIHLNRPLLGQRVYDLLCVVAAMADSVGSKEVQVVGLGLGGPVALHAAALEPKIARVTIDGAILSWADIVATPITKNQLSSVVPGALLSYDLPDLAAAIAPRALKINHPVDPAGSPRSQAQLDQAYAACKAAYRAAGPGETLVLKAEP
jgi:cephalosporin-C deacetylase-like acetyl esterase